MSGDLLSEVGEDRLVEELIQILDNTQQERRDVRVGAGDDCAVIAQPGGEEDLLFKTDAVIEGVHYRPEEDPFAVGAKALKRVVSDVAAMGGKPTHALVTVACSAEVQVDYMRTFYRGLVGAARGFGVAVVGGDTAGLPERSANVFTVSLIGTVPSGKAVLRSGASIGDALYVTGKLGGSLSSGRHLSFEPRIEAGSWLRTQRVSAMMDLSDGLGTDLPRMAGASGCGFVIDHDLLPLHPGSSVEDAIGNGEDYELLVASPHELPGSCPNGLPLTRIGKLVTQGEGQSTTSGWEYFKDQRGAH